ncbi:hypothetical protein [Cellvibrio mixtus]|uniref:hypothetical protein n=1 Tax=Cellvibrio mixtus TaxID=39650 RepID=UPI000587572F|nr:hypothetical protein [Cellvibrio mixtus]
MTNFFNRFFIACLALAFVGCATHSPSTPPSPPPVTTAPPPLITKPEAPAVVQPQPGAVPKPAAVLNPAALSLAKQARSQYVAQDYQGAIATAERGLRIERRAADLYLILAQSYVQLGLPQKAEMFVQQGLRFAAQGSEVASGLLRVREQVGN